MDRYQSQTYISMSFLLKNLSKIGDVFKKCKLRRILLTLFIKTYVYTMNESFQISKYFIWKKILPNFAQNVDLFCFPEAGRKSQKVFPGV